MVEYVAANMRHWDATCAELAARSPATSDARFPYPFGECLQRLAELEWPQQQEALAAVLHSHAGTGEPTGSSAAAAEVRRRPTEGCAIASEEEVLCAIRSLLAELTRSGDGASAACHVTRPSHPSLLSPSPLSFSPS